MGIRDYSRTKKVGKILEKHPSEITEEDCFLALSYFSETSKEKVYEDIKESLEEMGEDTSDYNIARHAKIILLSKMDRMLEEEVELEEEEDYDYSDPHYNSSNSENEELKKRVEQLEKAQSKPTICPKCGHGLVEKSGAAGVKCPECKWYKCEWDY